MVSCDLNDESTLVLVSSTSRGTYQVPNLLRHIFYAEGQLRDGYRYVFFGDRILNCAFGLR
jgi:hypothetical protein